MEKKAGFRIIMLNCLICLICFFAFFGCGNGEANKINSVTIKGNIQKGPFISGSSVTITALDNNLSQSGLVFNTTTKDDYGSFIFPEDFQSHYAEISATGFYFNEISGNLTYSYITLRALSDVSQDGNVNINVLTTLEIPRLYYLVKQEGKSFNEAKKQAEKEILSIFNINGYDTIDNFEKLDISKTGTGNGILLAVTAILQGNCSEAELSEMISKISLDIEKDGVLDNIDYINKIKDSASALNLISIRQNIENRYKSLGLQVTIPDFESFAKKLTPLGIISTSFVAGAAGIDKKSPSIGVVFNQEMNKETLNQSNVYITDGENIIQGVINYDDTLRTATYIPSSELSNQKTYTFVLAGSVQTRSGNSLPSAYSWSFTTASLSGTLKWSYPTGGVSSPTIGSDGTIYSGSVDGSLYAVNHDGTLKWKYDTSSGGFIYSTPAIGSDGAVYFGSYSGCFYALNSDGTLKWTYQTGYSVIFSNGSPIIGSDGTIYFGTSNGYIFALKTDGTLKWKFPAGNSSRPAIGTDGTIYTGSSDHYLYALNANGTLKWKYLTEDAVIASPVIGSDGTVYVGSVDYYFYAVNPDGTLKWKYKTGSMIYGSGAAIGSNGTIYVGSYDHYLYAFNSDGSLKWKYLTGDAVSPSPIIGSDGTIYVGSYDHYFYALKADGTLKWKYQTGGEFYYSAAIGSDETIYIINSYGGSLNALIP